MGDINVVKKSVWHQEDWLSHLIHLSELYKLYTFPGSSFKSRPAKKDPPHELGWAGFQKKPNSESVQNQSDLKPESHWSQKRSPNSEQEERSECFTDPIWAESWNE